MHKSILRLLWILLLMGSLGCSQNTPTTFWYNFEGTATLQIFYRNNPSKQVVTLVAHQFFPEEEFTLTDTLPAGSGTRTYQVPASWPQEVRYAVPAHEITFLLLPDTRLHCDLDLSNQQNWHPKLSGDLVVENRYLLQKEYAEFNQQSASRQRRMAFNAVSLKEYTQRMDSIMKEECTFLKSRAIHYPNGSVR